MWLGFARHHGAETRNLVVTQTAPMQLTTMDAQPAMSLGTYQRALAESPARLEALFDAQSSRPMGPPEPTPATALAHTNRDWIP
jgi:hypothetical protein